jgi:ketosteroid isomerase-like protein
LFEQGDMDGVFARLDDDVEWGEPHGYFVAPGGVRGKAAVAEALSRYPELWGEFALAPDEFIASGEVVIVLGNEGGTASATGRKFSGRFANVWRVRDGKAYAFEAFADTAMIWQALGGGPGEGGN